MPRNLDAPAREMTDADRRLASHETEILGGRCRTDGPGMGESSLTPLLLVVGGPDRDDEIVLLALDECYLPRETARQLAEEILRRLANV